MDSRSQASLELETAKAINELSLVPFKYGQCDCCMFAAGVAYRVHGVNLMDGWYYSTKREATSMIIHFGGLEGLVKAALGEPRPVSEIIDGEPILALTDQGPAVMGVRFQQRAVFKTPKGVTSLPITDERVLKGWRVSCLPR